MKVADLINFSGDMLKQLHSFGIRIDDYKYIELFKDYERMKSKGYKTVYVVAKLSERYSLSERLIYKVLRHFKSDCQKRATV